MPRTSRRGALNPSAVAAGLFRRLLKDDKGKGFGLLETQTDVGRHRRSPGVRFGRRLVLVLALLAGVLCLAVLTGRYLSASRDAAAPLALGPLYPPLDNGLSPAPQCPLPGSRSALAVSKAAGMPLVSVREGKRMLSPHAAVARLLLGSDVEEVNRGLLSARPWADSGSTWPLHPSGDYDFAEIGFIQLLYTFRDRPDRLYPETARHIADTLLIEDGNRPRPHAPRTLGLVRDTENHILMRESTRYLRNQWYHERGTPEERDNPKFDTRSNGLDTWMVGCLAEIQSAGFYEFNSIPYLTFSMRALLNLDAFASNREVALAARRLIDAVNWQYALGSLDLRRCVPFRRQARRASHTGLQADRHTPFMALWTDGPTAPPVSLREETIASVLPYRLPETVREWALEKPRPYFVKFGHGPNASPEIFSGGPGYLISAGGVHRGWKSMIAARPTSLMLRDGAIDLRDCFRLVGRGGHRHWNNTGVCSRFACSNGRVLVPSHAVKRASGRHWTLYAAPTPEIVVAVHEAPGVALLVLLPGAGASPESLAQALETANPDPKSLARVFRWPDGRSVAYDLDAPKDKWVITAVDGQAVDRNHDRWPQMDGDAPPVCMERR